MRKHTRRRRLSMTSLIDVIFLLLLFFMLTSTFSRYGEVSLAAAGSAGAAPSIDRPVFVQLSPDSITVNARAATLDTLSVRLRADRATDDPVTVVLALKGDVSAQRLTDTLVILNAIPGVRPVILGAT